MRRRQVTLRALLIVVLVAAAFLLGVRYERERRRREDAAIAEQKAEIEKTIIGAHPPLEPQEPTPWRFAPSFPFSLKTLQWLMALVAASFGGAAWQRSIDRAERRALKRDIRSLEVWNENLADALSKHTSGMDMPVLVVDPGDD